MIKIGSYKDLKEHINKKRHLILSFSQKLLNEAGAIRVVNHESGFKLESKGDLSFYENQLMLMVIDNLSQSQVKNVVGYICYSFFYYKLFSDVEHISDEEYHAVKTIYDNGWKYAMISEEVVNEYNDKLEAYNSLSDKDRVSIALGCVEGVSIPFDIFSNMKTCLFDDFEKIKPVNDLLLESKGFNLLSDVVSINGERGGFHEDARFFSFNVKIKEHENKEFTGAKKCNGIRYRIHGFETKEGFVNVFRELVPTPPNM